ncbi:MAG: beta-galactosidase [Rikenellaceae bacterium]
MKRKLFLLLAFTALGYSALSQSLRESAQTKMQQLEELIEKADSKKINTLKERTALRTAEIFMVYADWDAKNIERNKHHFSLVTRYKDEADKYANLLADFEREEIVKMMDSSISELNSIMSGEIKRLDSPQVDWTKTDVVGDEIRYEGKPVFLTDWTWKPTIDFYNEYHGDQDGFFLTPSFVESEDGRISPRVIDELKRKDSGSMGFIFFNHKGIPRWAKSKYPEMEEGGGLHYTEYDINHPKSREMQANLIKGVVPYMAGKNYTKLGYMLCNEPHWNTIKDSWAYSPFSDYAYKDFKVWLKAKHNSVEELNKVWGKNYSSFDDIDAPKVMVDSLRGTAMYFDFMKFNQDRVTDWFSFLAGEIKKYDSDAKTHIKIIPGMWAAEKRDSGIDLEALTFNSDIIGNDCSSCEEWMWGEPKFWEKNYSFDWIDICLSQDFMKSVAPDKIMYNTEGHFLSTGKSRDLYQTPQYARCNYWMAHIHGLTAMQTWYWCRREDGDSRSNQDSNGYGGSNNHQPRIVNEVHATMVDLNSVSDKIMTFQRQRKPIRLFYTEASAINNIAQMDNVFALYEKLCFEGTPLGFATEGIINNQDNDSWDVVVVSKTANMFEKDVIALQKYVDGGGIVVIDSESMLSNEYGNPLKSTLKSSKGKVIKVSDLNQLKEEAFAVVDKKGVAPELKITQDNGTDQPTAIWRAIDGRKGSKILNITNFGKNNSKITICTADGKPAKSVVDILNGKEYSNTLTLQPYDLYFVEVK